MDIRTDVKQYGAGEKTDRVSVDLPPTSDEVTRFHINADTDVRDEAVHHTLGPNPGQASPGDHIHDGGTSPYLLDGFSIQTSAAIATWRLQVEAALQRLGATIAP
jgi:hypothetical protein